MIGFFLLCCGSFTYTHGVSHFVACVSWHISIAHHTFTVGGGGVTRARLWLTVDCSLIIW